MHVTELLSHYVIYDSIIMFRASGESLNIINNMDTLMSLYISDKL